MERVITTTVLQSQDLQDWILGRINPNWLRDLRCREIVQLYQKRWQEKRGWLSLSTALTEADMSKETTDLASFLAFDPFQKPSVERLQHWVKVLRIESEAQQRVLQNA